jgi:hypothetical protein
VRRIGVLLATTADDVEHQAWVGAFLRALAPLGWVVGRNVTSAGQQSMPPNFADTWRNWLRSRPTSSWPPAPRQWALQASRTVPIVFTVLEEPVSNGFVESLARPGGNATSFMILTAVLLRADEIIKRAGLQEGCFQPEYCCCALNRSNPANDRSRCVTLFPTRLTNSASPAHPTLAR